jgi:hypothetical protein
MDDGNQRVPTPEEIDEESRRTRRLQFAVHMALSIIAQGRLPFEEAQELAAATKRVALTLFPDKEFAYDLIYRPKFQRLLNEVYRIQ